MKRLLVAFASMIAYASVVAFASLATLWAAGLAGPAAGVALAAPSAGACDRSRETLREAIGSFTEQLDEAGAAATSGDLAGAERSLRRSGTILTEAAAELRKNAETAQNPAQRKALEDVAAELETTGGGLGGLPSVQDLDTKRLELLAERVKKTCPN